MKTIQPGMQAGGPIGLESAVRGNTRFALELYKRLRATPGNLFFSPYSISTALAMTYAGARGETAVQIARALHFSLDQDQLHPAFARLEARFAEVAEKGQVRLRVANRVWPQAGFPLQEAFLALVKQYYGVQITALDYRNGEAARRTINAWVEEQTERKIKDLIPAGLLDRMTSLVLANAIYFKGNWASQFDPRLTHAAPFWSGPGRQAQAMLMAQKRQYRYGEAGGLQVLELPYAGEGLSMLVLLPAERDGLAKLEEALSPENLDGWARSLRLREVEVFLPRFELEFPFRLDETLKAMGMVAAFSQRADFSGISQAPLAISAVLHKAFVTVNEQGSEAAAATAVTMVRASFVMPLRFRADHPFIFLIRENRTGSILFLGRLVQPV